MANGHEGGERPPSGSFTAANPAPKSATTEEIIEAVLVRLATKEARERKATPPRKREDSPESPSLWEFIPRRYRWAVAVLAVLVGSSSASILANARAIWGLPEEVTQIKEDIKAIKDALVGAASRPQR